MINTQCHFLIILLRSSIIDGLVVISTVSVWWKYPTVFCYCASLHNSAFSEVTAAVWNWLWWEYLLQTNWQTLHIKRWFSVLSMNWTGFGKLQPVGQIQPMVCFYKVLLENSHAQLFTCCLQLLLYSGRVE